MPGPTTLHRNDRNDQHNLINNMSVSESTCKRQNRRLFTSSVVVVCRRRRRFSRGFVVTVERRRTASVECGEKGFSWCWSVSETDLNTAKKNLPGGRLHQFATRWTESASLREEGASTWWRRIYCCWTDERWQLARFGTGQWRSCQWWEGVFRDPSFDADEVWVCEKGGEIVKK